MAPLKRPSFIDSWLTDLQEDYRRYGKRKLVPWMLLLCLTMGGVVAYLLPSEQFWSRPDLSGVMLSAILTVNGLFLALSWSSFAKIYEIAAAPKLASFLRRHGLLRDYIFLVNYIHATQIAALIFSATTLIFCFATLPTNIEAFVPVILLRRLLSVPAFGFTIYALIYALGAVRMMQDLVWNSSYFASDSNDPSLQVHDGGRDVRSLE